MFPYQQAKFDYYQILQLSEDCVQSDIEEAFQYQGGTYHPNHFADAEEELKTKGQYIILSIKEAYEVLNAIPTRLRYDHLLTQGQLRIENTKLLNAQESQSNNDPAHAATNESAKKYWSMGLEAYNSGDFASAVLQIQFALQFEPSNPIFQEFLDKAKTESKKAPKQNNNPYKIRL